MLGNHGRLTAGVAVFAAVTALALAEEVGLDPVPQQRVLLLRNGEVIQGKISRVGELYYAALPSKGGGTLPSEWSGGEIRVKAADVEFCCRDLQEGYWRKRAAIQAGNVEEHLRLAQWCLRHDLPGCAARELADALEDDPTHPMIGLLERRLKVAMQPPSAHSAVSENAHQIGGLPTEPVDQAASSDDLDRLVRGLPPGSVETFTQTIQPLLINHCGVTGCHGPQSDSKFQLLRIPPGRPPSRRFTQRNLQAVLPWVDRENPAASRLLTAHDYSKGHTNTQPTGGTRGAAGKAVFGEVQAAQYKRMADWVSQLSGRPVPRVPETVTSREGPPTHAAPAELQGLDAGRPETPGAPDPQPAADGNSDRQEPPVSVSPVKRGAPLKVFVPVDPFDPAIFNRRYFGNPGSESPRAASRGACPRASAAPA